MSRKMFSGILILALVYLIVMPLLVTKGAYPYRTKPYPTSQLSALSTIPGWVAEPLKVTNGIEIPGLVRPATVPGAPWILFLPGNGGGQIEGGQKYLSRLAEISDGTNYMGLAVWGMRGYDSVDGAPDKNAFISDFLKAHKHLLEKYSVPPDSIHIVGFSLGTDFALLLAEELTKQGDPPASMVLLSTQGLTRAQWKMRRKEWFGRWLLPDYFDLRTAFETVTSPVLIVESENDILGDMDFIRSQLLGSQDYLQIENGSHSTSLEHPDALARAYAWITKH